MRLAFLGTPEAAVPALETLLERGHDVALVVTRPDRRRGRGAALEVTPVKRVALARGLAVTHRLRDVTAAKVERAVVVAYGALVPSDVLSVVPMLNVHFSLLPRWRGAAPVQRAILAGDARTGVTVISLEASLDTGPAHARAEVDVDDKDAATLTGELAALGARLVAQVLGDPVALAHPVAQSGEATYAEKLDKSELALDPMMAAVTASRVVRLGGAHLTCATRRVVVDQARVALARVDPGVVALEGEAVVAGFAEGSLELVRVRPAGRSTMAGVAWWHGLHDPASLEWSSSQLRPA